MQIDYKLLAQRARFFVLVGYFGLPVVFTVGILLWPSCNKQPNWVIWLIHMLPMLLFLKGVLTKDARTHVWLSFISLGYFLAVVPAVYICRAPMQVLETILIVQLFISAMFYVRWRSRELAQTDSLTSE